MPRALMCKTTRLYCLKQVSRGDFSRLRPQYMVRRICIRRKRTVHNRPTALPASAGLLYETDKSSLDAFFRKAKRRCLCHSNFLISELIDRADRKRMKLIQPIIVSNPFFPFLAFHTPGISLVRSRGHQYSLPQLNTALYRNICSLIDVCSRIFSSIICLHCVVFLTVLLCCAKDADVIFVH